jgi:GT2 family glycosyltransferase
MQRVVVIVLNHNKREMVLECLHSLERQAYRPCEIIVVDNASSDGSRAAIREHYPQIDLLCLDTNLGAIEGRNAGVAHARQWHEFDYLLFLDDDAETAVDSIRHLVNALDADPAAGIACGKTYIDFDSDTLMSAGIREQFHLGLCYDRGAGKKDAGRYDRDEYVDACGAFAFLIRASLFEELGGFDSAFTPYGWEEVDLCLRARARGYRTRYVPAAHFAHKGTRLGRRPLPGYERNKAKNYLILLARHTTLPQKLPAVIFASLRGLLLFARFAWQGNWSAIPAQLQGVRDYLLARNARGTNPE